MHTIICTFVSKNIIASMLLTYIYGEQVEQNKAS